RRSVERLRPEDYTKPETYRNNRPNVSMAKTLIPDAYTSEAFYEMEMEQVFAKSWVLVGCLSDFKDPGASVVANVAGQSVVVVKNADGELRAFYNVCRHRGVQLVEDGCEHVGKLFRCPYHNWAYDYNGTCLGTPLFTNSDIPEEDQGIFDMTDVQAFDKADYGLYPVRVEVWGFMVYVNLDPDAAPLLEQLGDLPERCAGYRLDEWEVVREKVYDIKANYKLVGENFMEYYHLPWVHPELVQVSKMKDHYRWQGPGMYTGMTTWPISQNSDDGGWQGLGPASFLDNSDENSGRFIWLFPNTALNLLPNHCLLLINQPDGPGRTIETLRLLAHRDSIGKEGAEQGIDDLVDFWHLVNMQDVEIVEKVQQGLSKKAYDGGRLCYRFEEPLHRFQNMIIDRMLGIDRIPEGDAENQTPRFVKNGH
ncbi:MAG: aromatic ring-hydroxylating dioxygenase subunit alpha, partial [Chloroflexota bacterium]